MAYKSTEEEKKSLCEEDLLSSWKRPLAISVGFSALGSLTVG